MLNDLTHFIDGKHIKGASGRFSDVFTPMTGEISARVPLAFAAAVRAAVENAKAAQPAWAATNQPASTARRFPMREAKSNAASMSSNLRSVFPIS